MRVLRLDETGDIRFGNGQADFFRDTVEAVAQTVMTRLMLHRGEWFLDISKGMPWYGSVLGHGTRPLIEPAIRSEIAGTQGVLRVDALSVAIDGDERTASIAATITTVFGQTTFEGVI